MSESTLRIVNRIKKDINDLHNEIKRLKAMEDRAQIALAQMENESKGPAVDAYIRALKLVLGKDATK